MCVFSHGRVVTSAYHKHFFDVESEKKIFRIRCAEPWLKKERLACGKAKRPTKPTCVVTSDIVPVSTAQSSMEELCDRGLS